MQKIVINSCFGGFSLSPLAIKRLAELNGQKAYFFKDDYNFINDDKYIPITLEEATNEGLFFTVFNIPNPEEILKNGKEWHEMTEAEQKVSNELYKKYSLNKFDRGIKRDDSKLIKVVEELGKKVNGSYADLKIVEVPDDVKWRIEEYDGSENVSEVHRTWA